MLSGRGLSISCIPNSTRATNSGASMNRHRPESMPGRSGSLWSDVASRFARRLPPCIEKRLDPPIFSPSSLPVELFVLL